MIHEEMFPSKDVKRIRDHEDFPSKNSLDCSCLRRNVMPREAAGFVKICASSVQNVVDSIIAGRESRMDQQNL